MESFCLRAQDLVRQVGCGAHRAHVVNANHVDAAENAGSDSGGGGELGLLDVLLGEEALARRAGHDGQIDERERAEVSQNQGILFLALAESEARVYGQL